MAHDSKTTLLAYEVGNTADMLVQSSGSVHVARASKNEREPVFRKYHRPNPATAVPRRFERYFWSK